MDVTFLGPDLVYFVKNCRCTVAIMRGTIPYLAQF